MADDKRLSAGSAVQIKSFSHYRDVLRNDQKQANVQEYAAPIVDAQFCEVREDLVRPSTGMVHDRRHLWTIALSFVSGAAVGLLLGGTVAASGLLATMAFLIGSVATITFLMMASYAGIRMASLLYKIKLLIGRI